MKLNTLFMIASLACQPFSMNAHADEATKSPRLVVHLLDYLSKDYAGAVSEEGKVLSKTEFGEQKEFSESALSMSETLPEINSDKEVVAGIKKLKDLIHHQAKPSQVSPLALELKQKVIALAHIVQVPKQWPSLAHGKELFQRNCVTCHGDAGRGDGPAGMALKPKPANFLSAEVAQEINPFRAFNTIRVGVPGTGMAAWPMFADQDVWDLAFYVTSLHASAKAKSKVSASDLSFAATQSDAQLMASLSGSDEDKKDKIVALRTFSGDSGGTGSGSSDGDASNSPENRSSLPLARGYLAESEKAYASQDYRTAKQRALLAYLEGIEPVEPRLRANDPAFVSELEGKMANVRAAIEAKKPLTELQDSIRTANAIIDQADGRLKEEAPSPWVTFILTAGILLREGFEAILILIALLAVIKASGSKQAARWVHGGWIAALALGVATWFSSGWLMAISGAQREMLEAVTSIVAVLVLLYLGFWLHSKTEISRWNAFIRDRVQTMLEGSNLWGLAAISFMAVFREAFETVLFMRAITLEGGAAGTSAMGLGVLASLAMIIALSWALLRYSAKLPIRKIFSISSILMAVLAIILTGKGLHSLQETGFLSVTSSWWSYRLDLFGFYPTWETLLPQLLILGLVYGLWQLGKRPPTQSERAGI